MTGRAAIIKSILSAMPIYGMMIWLIPKGVCNQLKRLKCSFLWGGKEGEKKVAWIKWEDICRAKIAGGVGFKDLSSFIRTILGKWI